jgi:hypothetical protein
LGLDPDYSVDNGLGAHPVADFKINLFDAILQIVPIGYSNSMFSLFFQLCDNTVLSLYELCQHFDSLIVQLANFIQLLCLAQLIKLG